MIINIYRDVSQLKIQIVAKGAAAFITSSLHAGQSRIHLEKT